MFSCVFVFFMIMKVLLCQDCIFEEGFDKCLDYSYNGTLLMTKSTPFRMILYEKFEGTDEFFCACDDECSIYDDCCENVNHQMKNSQKKGNPNWSCIEDIFGSSVGILGVNSCPVSFANYTVKAKCEDDVGLISNSYLHENILVYSTSSETFYKNIYCAVCNDDLNNLVTFPMNFSCGGTIKQRQDLMDLIWTFDATEIMWRYGNTKTRCEIQQNSHLKKIFSGELKGRPCRNHINTCPKSYTNSDLAKKCSGSTSYVFSYKNEAYKNIHCAFCNGIEDTDCQSIQKATPKQISFSLITLLNMRFEDYQSTVSPLGRAKKFKSNTTAPVNRTICKRIEIASDSSKNTGDEQASKETDESIEVCADQFQALPTLNDNIQALLSYFCLIASICCLILQLTVYLLIAELRTFSGKILMCLSLSLLIAHMSFIFHSVKQSKIFCVVNAISTHYFFLCSFFWMNVISFDIYTVFKRLDGRHRNSKSLIGYWLYAWICPAIIVAAAIANEYLGTDNEYQPKYGVINCWFGQPKALLIFFIIPLTVIVVLNIYFFVMTIMQLMATKKMTQNLLRKQETIQFKLYIRIALVMGLTWAFGVAASFINTPFLWYPFIVLNGLQGVFIFISFVFKREILDSLKAVVRTESQQTKSSILSKAHTSQNTGNSKSSNI